ncbi:MAG TPA: ZIP family metal transporter [Elusimicrobiota bacterium]|nr:ZIP family metal transporter [Elusimicrobiota bacterium]
MHSLLLDAVVSAIVVSLISLVGIAALFVRHDILLRGTFMLVSLATGALFGDAIFHLLPQVFAAADARLRSSLWVLAGIFSSFVFEKFLRWKYEHGLHESDHHAPGHIHPIKPVGRIILVSDGLHNLIDGMAIGASYLAGRQVGLATTLAVILHELPHEFGDFGILLDAGYRPSRALAFNFVCACVSILGVFAAFGFQAGMEDFTGIALPITAGSFLYIAGSSLTPELQKESAPVKSLLQFLGMLSGAGLMFALLALES